MSIMRLLSLSRRKGSLMVFIVIFMATYYLILNVFTRELYDHNKFYGHKLSNKYNPRYSETS